MTQQNKIPAIFKHLTFYVLFALILAVFIGYFFPALAVKAEPLGTYFVSIIKLFIPPIIFLTIVSGISGMSNLKKVGRIGIKSLFYFEIVTTISLTIGIVLAEIIKPGHIGKTGLAVSDCLLYTSNSKQ